MRAPEWTQARPRQRSFTVRVSLTVNDRRRDQLSPPGRRQSPPPKLVSGIGMRDAAPDGDPGLAKLNGL